MESFNSFLFAFLALVWLLWVVQVEAQSRVHEVQALTSFRQSLQGGDVNMSNAGYWFSWNESDENACGWMGVTCTANSTVADLNLSGWGLPHLDNLSALSQLPDLLQLDLSSNSFFGLIPNDIGSLTQLTRLDLSENNLYGQIPPSITTCRSLQYLSLENNSLSGIPDLSDLVHLQFILLAGNFLNGSFPKELAEMSTLVTIDLSWNQLSGKIPSLVSSTYLVNLFLNQNGFSGFNEPLHLNAPNLRQLDVSENLLEGIIPLVLTNLSNLVALKMSWNKLSGTIPSGFSFGDGSYFDFSHNQLSGSIPVELLEAPVLTISSLDVSYNLLNGSLPTPTVYSDGVVTFLDLSHNQLMGSIPSPLMNTVILDLHDNFLSGDIVDVLVNCLTIGPVLNAHLILENNGFTGDLSRMTYMWANWTSLNIVDLSNNNLSWTTTESIPDPLSAALYNFPMYLQEFQVGGNNFSGTSLPGGPLSTPLVSLNILDLSNNQLKGTISGEVFNDIFPFLQFLNLSNNEATGPVPDNIITLFEYRLIFDGYIIDFQRVLDLSNNKLSGALPLISLNSSLIASVFAGNDGLCGYPLTQCPPQGTHVQLWVLLITIGGSLLIIGGTCVVATWQWRVYHKRHEQDADLIQTLMERDSATLMPLRDLKRATNNFSESACIGEGGFGTVYMGNLNNGTKVAIKRSKREGSQADKQQFLNEVRILSQVNHRHLVKLLGCCMENKISLLIFEFVSNGTLQEHLQGKIGDTVGLSWKHRLKIAIQTADALNYLHCGTSFPIYHRDVKSANILLNDDLSTKVADFGISKLAPMQATHISTAGMGTIGYIDPEYYTYHRLTDRSDVYSFGVVLLELISAKPAIFWIDGEPVNLVMFAIPHIKSGDMQPLIDATLLEVYNDASGHGKQSMLNVGRLAVECLAMPSKGRPSMGEVWKELQKLCLELNGTSISDDLCSHSEDDYSLRVPLCQTLWNQTDSDLQNDDVTLELSTIIQTLDVDPYGRDNIVLINMICQVN